MTPTPDDYEQLRRERSIRAARQRRRWRGRARPPEYELPSLKMVGAETLFFMMRVWSREIKRSHIV